MNFDNMNRLRHSRHRQVEFYSQTQTNLHEKNVIASWKMKSNLDIPSHLFLSFGILFYL